MDDLVERLRATEFDGNSSRAPYQRLINPAGPEAADRIEKLEAENARLSTAVCSGILGDLLTADEGEALVAFVKDLRARATLSDNRGVTK